jgi:hypothetical protein
MKSTNISIRLKLSEKHFVIGFENDNNSNNIAYFYLNRVTFDVRLSINVWKRFFTTNSNKSLGDSWYVY